MKKAQSKQTTTYFPWLTLASVEDRRNGVLKPKPFERRMCRYLGGALQTSITCSFEGIGRSCRAEDADLKDNRLATINDTSLIVYDVSLRCGVEERLFQRIVEIPLPNENRRYSTVSLPSVRWSSEGCFLSTAGTPMDMNALRILDVSTLQAIETIKFETFGSKFVHTHEHSNIDPALIAIGTSVKQVFITDLRTGNVMLSNETQHTDGVNCLAWSFSDENVLVSTSTKEALVWDKRYLAKTAVKLLDGHNFNISPDVKFLDSNRILVMTCNKAIYLNDVYTGAMIDVINDVYLRSCFSNARYKFGLNREASIVYFPAKRAIRGIDLTTNQVVMDAKGGHIYPPEMVVYNDYSKELYTFNRTPESFVWTPFR